jgi:hypothetical protein
VRSEKTQVPTAKATSYAPRRHAASSPACDPADTSRKTATKILVEFAEQGLVGLDRINNLNRSLSASASLDRPDEMPLAHALTTRFTAHISRRDDKCIRTHKRLCLTT